MTYFYFSKATLGWTDCIIVFEQGNLGMPVCILQKNDIDRLLEEWQKKGK